MKIKSGIAIAVLSLSLGACAALQNLEGTFQTITTTTVKPEYVNIAINAYEGLKATATGYATYCLQNKFPQPVCSAANRRAVIRFVKAGDGAVVALSPALTSGAPLLSTTYNTLVGAINGLQAAPITTRS